MRAIWLLRHSDSRILDGEDQPARTITLLSRHTDSDLTRLGEFAGIAEQIKQCLPNLGQISKHTPHIIRTVHLETIAFTFDERLNSADHLIDHLTDVKGLKKRVPSCRLQFSTRSRMSLMSAKRCLPALWIFLRSGMKSS